jgi:hypothetical protein
MLEIKVQKLMLASPRAAKVFAHSPAIDHPSFRALIHNVCLGLLGLCL